MDINEVFGKKVLERRLSLKISQETLAYMADYGAQNEAYKFR